MMVPVRCFTCGKVLAQYWDAYQERLARGEKAGAILDSLGVERYCCRRMLLTHVDLMDDVGPYG
jgi:DNA-directed RNA polymerase subunit N